MFLKIHIPIGVIDFAWLSDVDDSLWKAHQTSIDFVAVSKPNSTLYSKPSQSSFKTGEYPFTRTVYVIAEPMILV